jgi:hypothetical protein
MPGLTGGYEVLLDFKNDTMDAATVQLARDYGQSTGSTVLLRPGESVTLVLDAGASYCYALKTRAKVANVTCVCDFTHTRIQLSLSHTFTTQCSSMARRARRHVPPLPGRSCALASAINTGGDGRGQWCYHRQTMEGSEVLYVVRRLT